MKIKVVKAKHPKDWTNQTSNYNAGQTRPGGKNGIPEKLPSEYHILGDKYAQVYVSKLLNKKGSKSNKYLKNQIKQIEDE